MHKNGNGNGAANGANSTPSPRTNGAAPKKEEEELPIFRSGSYAGEKVANQFNWLAKTNASALDPPARR